MYQYPRSSAGDLWIGFRQTEDAVAAREGQGLWDSMTGLGSIQRRYLDSVQSEALPVTVNSNFDGITSHNGFVGAQSSVVKTTSAGEVFAKGRHHRFNRQASSRVVGSWNLSGGAISRSRKGFQPDPFVYCELSSFTRRCFRIVRRAAGVQNAAARAACADNKE